MFRESVLQCPSCGDSVLRPYAARLVCDRCGGFFLSLGDLQQTLQEISGQAVTLELFDEQVGTHSCPRCTGTMERCKLRVRVPGFASTTKHEHERCLADGMWFAAGELEDVMARLHWMLTHHAN